ncbi:MAG: PTS sugar transporter subunit IIA [Candidatus Glassbacteria bacterium]
MKESAMEPDLVVRTRDECIARMAGLIREGFGVKGYEDLVESLLERESVLSTGIGDGIAIPHTTSEEVEEAAIAVARVRRGLEFNAIDGKPVHIIFLIVGSEKHPNLHLRILARLARLVKHPSFIRALKKSKSANEMLRSIKDEENRHIV